MSGQPVLCGGWQRLVRAGALPGVLPDRETDLTADDLRGNVSASSCPKDATKGRRRELLANGPLPATEMNERLQAELWAFERTIRRSKAELGVRSRLEVDSNGQQRWIWALPKR